MKRTLLKGGDWNVSRGRLPERRRDFPETYNGVCKFRDNIRDEQGVATRQSLRRSRPPSTFVVVVAQIRGVVS